MLDYLRTILSIAVCGVRAALRPTQLVSLILSAIPHLIVIAAFAAFIIINGSVVLGDKTNHVATLNLPQMLYIWPYFVFFSWPMILPQFLRIPVEISARISSLMSRLPSGYEVSLPRLVTIIAFTVLALAVVHVNTVVHPFMLADNRHYTFYIFKRLLRPWWMRYAATPLYVISGWACIEMRGPAITIPKDTPANRTQMKVLARTTTIDKNAPAIQPIQLPNGERPVTTSFVLIWLATTTLQLCTAPLFEPRYLIIPWLFWRIHLPLQSEVLLQDTAATPKEKIKVKADPGIVQAILASYDWRLVLETLWYLLINAVTGYIFVTWTFEWPLQPGEVQRFMW
jgi:alpha-1,2-glucosyltransferase